MMIIFTNYDGKLYWRSMTWLIVDTADCKYLILLSFVRDVESQWHKIFSRLFPHLDISAQIVHFVKLQLNQALLL